MHGTRRDREAAHPIARRGARRAHEARRSDRHRKAARPSPQNSGRKRAQCSVRSSRRNSLYPRRHHNGSHCETFTRNPSCNSVVEIARTSPLTRNAGVPPAGPAASRRRVAKRAKSRRCDVEVPECVHVRGSLGHGHRRTAQRDREGPERRSRRTSAQEASGAADPENHVAGSATQRARMDDEQRAIETRNGHQHDACAGDERREVEACGRRDGGGPAGGTPAFRCNEAFTSIEIARTSRLTAEFRARARLAEVGKRRLGSLRN